MSQETLSMELGGQNTRARTQKLVERGHLSSTTVGQSLQRQVIGPFSEVIKEELERAKGLPGPRHWAKKYTTKLTADKTAFLATRTIIDVLMRNTTSLSDLSIKVGEVLESELIFESFSKEDPESWKRALTNTDKHQPKYRRKKLVGFAGTANFELERIPFRDRGSWGLWVVKLFEESLGLIETYKNFSIRKKGKAAPIFCSFTKEFIEWLNNTFEKHESLFPLYLPLVNKPKSWKNQYEGAYPETVTMRSGIVKRIPFRQLQHFGKDVMPDVFDSVNMLQRVPWVLHQDTYELIKHFWEIGQPVDKIPQRLEYDLPEKPEDIDDDAEVRKLFRRESAQVYRKNVELRTKKSHLLRVLLMANTIKDNTFYFPYNCDFRGRVYPIPSFLSPQGTSMAKSLLSFKESKPISTKDGSEDWLAIHGANTWGLDKKPFADRLDWVHSNSNLIKSIANDPLEFTQWRDADEPLGFFRWCCEWAGYLDLGSNFQSNLPVQMDGTNNGLQLFSLIMRDEKEAIATNVAPGDYPHDIYQDIADSVTETLRNSQDPRAAYWTNFFEGGSFPRAATKRPVMTFPYGAVVRSCADRIMEWYTEESIKRNGGHDRGLRIRNAESWGRVTHLAEIVWSEIRQSLSGSVKAMDWLRACAKKVMKESQSDLHWSSPSGFPVRQEYKGYKRVCITTKLGEVIRVGGREALETRNKKKSVQAISANFIHSVDAALLIGSVNRAKAAGVNSIAPCHDCFGTLAADAPTMARSIREEAVEMFSGNLLEDFRAEVQRLTGVVLDEPPEQGELDPKCVLESLYFFS